MDVLCMRGYMYNILYNTLLRIVVLRVQQSLSAEKVGLHPMTSLALKTQPRETSQVVRWVSHTQTIGCFGSAISRQFWSVVVWVLTFSPSRDHHPSSSQRKPLVVETFCQIWFTNRNGYRSHFARICVFCLSSLENVGFKLRFRASMRSARIDLTSRGQRIISNKEKTAAV